MPGKFAAALLLGVSAIVTGMVVGYYMAMTGGLPVSAGVLVIIGLTFGALLTAFHGGQARGGTDAKPRTTNEAWEAFRRELNRSRRFERSFVLMRMPADAGAATDGRTASIPSGPLGMLPLVLRGIDHAWTIEGSTYVLLPESDEASAMSLLARLHATMPDAATLENTEIAEFPRDGVTTGALIAGLRTVPAPGDASPVRLVPSRADEDRQRDRRMG
ncbi:MAG: hypothetical protein ABIO99_00665 [Candidatus Limnocylindria bacterium]